MSTATTVSRTPSAWRLGTVNIKPAVIICLATVFRAVCTQRAHRHRLPRKQR